MAIASSEKTVQVLERKINVGLIIVDAVFYLLDRVGWLITNRNQSQSMGNIFVIQDGGVLVELHQVDSQGWNFGDHDTTQRIGNASVGLAQDEFDFMREHVQDLHLGETLVRHS